MLVKEKLYFGEFVCILEDLYLSLCFRVWIVLEKFYLGMGCFFVWVFLIWKNVFIFCCYFVCRYIVYYLIMILFND